MSASSSSIAGTGQRSIHAWLLLLPALVLLLTFTHWPAVATFIDSFYSTPKGARAVPSRQIVVAWRSGSSRAAEARLLAEALRQD